MFVNVVAKFDVHHKNLLLVSLLFAVMLISSLLAPVLSNNSVSPLVSGAPDKVVVSDETALLNAVNNAIEGQTITFDKDITITESLDIGANKNITLTSNRVTGFCKLIGTNRVGSTITVMGSLRLDGITVTCAKDNTAGWGVLVGLGGTLILSDGEITGNNAGGVSNYGSFEMSGGKIFNNTANYSGGGVFVAASGSFTMSGGEITNNIAIHGGGGVYVSSSSMIFSDDVYNGSFVMSGGTISGNIAHEGGGVYNMGMFNKQGGTIFGNTGGDVYNRYGDNSSSDGWRFPNGNNGFSEENEWMTERNNELVGGTDFSLEEVIIICTSVIIGVVVVLFLYSKKRETQMGKQEKLEVHSCLFKVTCNESSENK